MRRILALAAVIVVLVPALSFSNDEDTLKKLRSQIQQQEKELKSLESSKANLSKQIGALEKNRADIKYAATLTSNQIAKNNARLNDLRKQEGELNRKSEQYRAQATTALMFLLDNSGTLTARALLGGKDDSPTNPAGSASTTAAVMEILDQLNNRLLERISQYNLALQEIAKVKADINATNVKLEDDKKQSDKLMADLKRTSGELSNKMTLMRHDEKAKKEYLDMMKKEQERLTKLIEQRKVRMAESGFAKEKGLLPYPVTGRIVEHYGETVISGIRVMNVLCKIRPSGNGEVKPVYAGKVIYIQSLGSAGNTVMVQHDGTFLTVYSNLDEFYVTNMQDVEKNTAIGRINVDLKDDSSYLTFGVYRNKTAVNPAEWLKK